MCMPTAIVTVVGWPTLDPWVPPSIDFFYNAHVCVVTAAVLPKLLIVQSLHATSSLGYSATHMCVCVLTAAIGRPTLS